MNTTDTATRRTKRHVVLRSEQLAALDLLAMEQDLNVSQLVRRAVDLLLAQQSATER